MNIKRNAIAILSNVSLLTLTSCFGERGTFLKEETLTRYGLTSEFPTINTKDSYLKNERFKTNLSLEEYSNYAKSIFQYLKDGHYFYVGTYEQKGLIAEIAPYYEYKEIESTYDWSKSKHEFVYSISEDIGEIDAGKKYIVDANYIILERSDGKFNTTLFIQNASLSIFLSSDAD